MARQVGQLRLAELVAALSLGACAAHSRRCDSSARAVPCSAGSGSASVGARILGAADEAAAALRLEARTGRMDGAVVEAVLGVAGHRVRRKPEGVAAPTAREIEVLRLLVRGLSTKQIGSELAITAKTAANHIEHIYAKIDATNRATPSLFAMQHGLFPEEVLA